MVAESGLNRRPLGTEKGHHEQHCNDGITLRVPELGHWVFDLSFYAANCYSLRMPARDRALIWNQRHLMTLLREYEDFYNAHRPHRAPEPSRAAPPLPDGVTDLDHVRLRRAQIPSRTIRSLGTRPAHVHRPEGPSCLTDPPSRMVRHLSVRHGKVWR